MAQRSNAPIGSLSSNRTAGVIGAALTVLVGCLLVTTPLGNGLGYLSFDLFAQIAPSRPLGQYLVVEMDELSYRALDQTYPDWDRTLHARLIDKMRTDGARLVVMDVYFSDSETNRLSGQALQAANGRNSQLAEAIASNTNVVLAADWIEGQHELLAGGTTVLPYEPIRVAAGSNWGIAKVVLESDDTVRRHYGGSEYDPSISWTAATRLTHRLQPSQKIA